MDRNKDMGLPTSAFPPDLLSPGLMPLPDASQQPQHVAGPSGESSPSILQCTCRMALAEQLAATHGMAWMACPPVARPRCTVWVADPSTYMQ